MTNSFGKVAVLMGGDSNERAVSLLSGDAVVHALKRLGIQAEAFDPSERDIEEIKNYSRVFIALHGRGGEDGSIQAFLKSKKVAYTGSDALSSSIGMDKLKTKLLWRSLNISTPDFLQVTEKTSYVDIVNSIGSPFFIKPANEGSSIGIDKIKNEQQYKDVFLKTSKIDSNVIVEKFVDGDEYTVAIVNDKTLPVIKIKPSNEFYDYEAKYIKDDTQYICPSGIEKDKEVLIAQEALEAFRVLGCSSWGRVDFMINQQGQHYFIEVNTSPGMTSHSLVPMAAKEIGINFDQLVLEILKTADVK
ncbi:MAG TPA: D-alanine--D-alanine ligase [Methylophilaceae bacterium]|nr:D-alanine--D-alanine ligase [Methylophilaceae bacterium]HBO18196.1 D-alanine--D-alanine ligase [Methylophilaceae bacterium]HCB68238.1 D-alanine--D-alanine ligase [Methylophilaceae bacterium]